MTAIIPQAQIGSLIKKPVIDEIVVDILIIVGNPPVTRNNNRRKIIKLQNRKPDVIANCMNPVPFLFILINSSKCSEII